MAQTKFEQTVFVVDDDAGVRDSLGLLLGLRGFRTAMFASGEDFLATLREDWCGCVLIDVKMNGMSGLELQQRMQEQRILMPAVIITAHGDIASARVALKTGAVDFLEKPLDEEQLVSAISSALDRDRRLRSQATAQSDAQRRIATLSEREREVMRSIAAGKHNREIAEELGISPRTVEVYRARLMDKLGVRRLSELITLALEAEGNSAPAEP